MLCSKQVDKEKRELARQYGMVRSEVSGGEIAEDLEKERRSFQLSMCEVSDPTSPPSRLPFGCSSWLLIRITTTFVKNRDRDGGIQLSHTIVTMD